MEHFTKIVSGFQPLRNLTLNFRCSEYASVKLLQHHIVIKYFFWKKKKKSKENKRFCYIGVIFGLKNLSESLFVFFAPHCNTSEAANSLKASVAFI